MDLEGDIQKEVERVLGANGVKYKAKNYADSLTDYLTLNRKYIKQQPREVLLSKELSIKQSSDPNRWNQLQNIIRAVKKGGNLNQYQSERLYQVNFHDYLLYNWNIHHLHLSSEQNRKDKRFNKRTKYLVFACVKKEAIYFLDFASHDQANIFAEENWLRIIANNWPSLLTPYDGDPIFSNGQKITTALRNELWNTGYSIGFTKVDDNAYVDPGIGITSSGHSILVMIERNEIIRWVYEHGKLIIESKTEFEEAFAKLFNISSEKIRYKARLTPRIQIYEQTTGDILFEYPNYITKRA